MSKNAKGKKRNKGIPAAEPAATVEYDLVGVGAFDEVKRASTAELADDSDSELSPEPGSEPASGASSENLRKPVTLRLNVEAVDYFKAEAERTGIPYQNIINAFLVQCMREERHLSLV